MRKDKELCGAQANSHVKPYCMFITVLTFTKETLEIQTFSYLALSHFGSPGRTLSFECNTL